MRRRSYPSSGRTAGRAARWMRRHMSGAELRLGWRKYALAWIVVLIIPWVQL